MIFIIAVFYFIKNDSLTEILKKIQYQESQNLIMDNLDEILISKSKRKINYIN